jgi:hypothetical protein
MYISFLSTKHVMHLLSTLKRLFEYFMPLSQKLAVASILDQSSIPNLPFIAVFLSRSHKPLNTNSNTNTKVKQAIIRNSHKTFTHYHQPIRFPPSLFLRLPGDLILGNASASSSLLQYAKSIDINETPSPKAWCGVCGRLRTCGPARGGSPTMACRG